MQTAPVDVGDEVPDFNLDSQLGPIAFHEMIHSKWGLLFTVQAAFDPVATTDLGMLCKLKEEFEARNVNVVALGIDTVSNNRRWIRDIEELQSVKFNIPLVSDIGCNVLKKLNCAKMISPLHKEALPVSVGVFLIDIDRRIRACMRYSSSTGRNLYEILRLMDALQVVTLQRVVCPSNWGSGQDVLVRSDVPSSEATKILPKGFVEIKPWFRLTPCPDDT